jgi:23S rRNA pseudouridine2604 synthase
MNNDLTNLNKYISSSGFCSRRDADKLIEQARVTINGELVLPGARVAPGDVVEVDGEPIKSASKKRPVYIAFNKPVGVTSTTDVKDRSNIIYYINHPKRIFPVGRLDKDSDGLIFLTNDGDIVNKILRASNNHEKEYIVNVDRAVTSEFVSRMSSGVPVLGKVTNKCFVRQEGSRRFRIVLTQGLNRQIRRMCEFLEYKVVSLTRVRIMNVDIGNLPVGKWRYLTLPEIDQMEKMVASSSKTDVGAKTGKSAGTKDGRPKQYIPKKKMEKPFASSGNGEESARAARPAKGAVAKDGRAKPFNARKNSETPVAAHVTRKKMETPVASSGKTGRPVKSAKPTKGAPAKAGRPAPKKKKY